MLLNYLTFFTRIQDPADITPLIRLIHQRLEQKQFWAAESLLRLLVPRAASQTLDIAKRLEYLHPIANFANMDVCEGLGVHGLWLSLCESELQRPPTEQKVWSFIWAMTEKYWQIIEQQIHATHLSDTDSEPEFNPDSNPESEVFAEMVRTGRAPPDEYPAASSSRTDSQRTRSRLRMDLIIIDSTVAAESFRNAVAKEAVMQLDDLCSRAVANHDNFLIRTIKWRVRMLSSKEYPREYLLDTDIVPKSVYKWAQQTFDSDSESDVRQNERSRTTTPIPTTSIPINVTIHHGPYVLPRQSPLELSL